MDLKALQSPGALENTELLVLPYGSAVPTDAWKASKLICSMAEIFSSSAASHCAYQSPRLTATFVQGRPQDTYSRALDLRHTYEVPVARDAHFAWRPGYAFDTTPKVQAEKFFTVEGHLNGLGYMVDATGLLAAAPVIVIDPGEAMPAAASSASTFSRQPGTGRVRMAWRSFASLPITRARVPPASPWRRFSLSSDRTSLLRSRCICAKPSPAKGEVRVELLSADKVLDAATLPVENEEIADLPAPFHTPLPAGFYKVRATYRQQGQFSRVLRKWFLGRGTQFPGPGRSPRSQRRFPHSRWKAILPCRHQLLHHRREWLGFLWPAQCVGVGKRFCGDGRARRHVRPHRRLDEERQIHRARNRGAGRALPAQSRGLSHLRPSPRHLCQLHLLCLLSRFRRTPAADPQKNPYIDEDALHAQQAYVRAVVRRFASVPWLCWDLINEPSFSNPLQIFKGNIPNGDAAEVSAWHAWLRDRYKDLSTLADAWAQTPEQLGSFDSIPLPSVADLTYERYGNPRQVRALDYNLFAQDMFSHWVQSMVAVIRQSGSSQLIDVGQDEGGVTNRVLNQFYGLAGVSFTTNHTYWQDDALLWDSIAAKLPGMPNITGETGYQPVWAPDGTWRYDEFTGLPLTERKWALGFAAGSSGAMQWDWAREVDFGMQRSDGSAKVWEPMMQRVGEFAQRAAPYATDFIKPDIAIILPQSFQLSVSNALAIEAQQNAVRALYYYARGEAYAVGEYQIASLGSPKLIILPSSFALTEDAWQAIVARVKAGAVFLVTGPFGGDAHFHPTGRQDQVGLAYLDVPLTLRSNAFKWPGGEEEFTFAGNKTTVLSRAQMPGDQDWAEKPLGKGKILFAALPLELNQNLQAVGDIYRYAMKAANISPTYTTTLNDAGILICPTRLPKATLYVLTSESNQKAVSFHDVRSGKDFSGQLENGRAALLLIGDEGKLITSYNWP